MSKSSVEPTKAPAKDNFLFPKRARGYRYSTRGGREKCQRRPTILQCGALVIFLILLAATRGCRFRQVAAAAVLHHSIYPRSLTVPCNCLMNKTCLPFFQLVHSVN